MKITTTGENEELTTRKQIIDYCHLLSKKYPNNYKAQRKKLKEKGFMSSSKIPTLKIGDTLSMYGYKSFCMDNFNRSVGKGYYYNNTDSMFITQSIDLRFICKQRFNTYPSIFILTWNSQYDGLFKFSPNFKSKVKFNTRNVLIEKRAII